MPTHSLDFDYENKTIQEFVLLFKNGQLNLEPGFQRDSVWTFSDRKKLIESLLQNYPIPSVFLYRQNENGKLRYDVIDGKQRIETVLMFQGTGNFRVYIRKSTNLHDRNKWHEQHAWLLEKLELFYKVFSKRVRKLENLNF